MFVCCTGKNNSSVENNSSSTSKKRSTVENDSGSKIKNINTAENDSSSTIKNEQGLLNVYEGSSLWPDVKISDVDCCIGITNCLEP